MNEERNTKHGFVYLVSLKGLSVPKLQISKNFKGKHLESVCSIGAWAAMGLPWEVVGGPMGLPRKMGC